MLKRFPLVPVLVTLILALDQLTKWLVTSQMAVGQSVYPIPALAPFVAITYVTNTGVSFGLFQNANALFAGVSIVVSVVVLRYLLSLPKERWLVRLALALVLAGAVGNLLDRLRLGFVVDFVAVGWLPKFNIADASIVVGVIVLALTMLLEGRQPPPQADRIHEEHEETRIGPA